jgi:hypothetical protein
MRAIVRKRLRAAIGFVAAGAAIGAVVGLLIHQMEGGGPLPHVSRGVATEFLIGFRAT